jgi:outer membrane protein TolC
MALENNQALTVQEVNPAIRRTVIAEERSAFDLALVGAYSRTEDHLSRELLVETSVDSLVGDGTVTGIGSEITVPLAVETKTKTRVDAGSAGVSEHLPTGTDVSMTIGPSRTVTRYTSSYPTAVARGNDTAVNASTLELTVTQKLLRGAGLGVNLASLRQAKVDVRMSEYELRGFVEDLVSQVEQTYWDYVLAQRQIRIFEDSLAVAQTQADEVSERIRIGKTAESERAAAEAEVAQRRSSLIDTRSSMEKFRLLLLRLLNPSNGSWSASEIRPKTEPVAPEIRLDGIGESILLAKRMRPDLNQARLQIKRDDLELVKTKNGLLPQLDLFIKLGKDLNRTEYADSFQGSQQDLRDTNYLTQVGVQFSYPLGNRAARARDQRAQLTRHQDLDALANMAQLVEQDIRTAYVEINRSREQIAANAATRRLQEQTLQSEMERFRVGKSTALLVVQAQRDLLSAQIGEVQAMAAHLKAIVNMYRLEGSLLERRGVACPGREPVTLEDRPSSAPVR